MGVTHTQVPASTYTQAATTAATSQQASKYSVALLFISDMKQSATGRSIGQSVNT